MQCQADGCIKEAIKKGYCQTHYMRIYRHGDLIKRPTSLPKGRRCSIEGCNKIHFGKGFCVAHYMSDRRKDKPKTSNKNIYACSICGNEYLGNKSKYMVCPSCRKTSAYYEMKKK